MKMISMEIKEGKTDSCVCSVGCGCDSEGPKYPYGLMIYLEDEQLNALGVDGLPEVGSEMLLSCMVRVTSCSVNEREGEDKTTSCGMQITAIGTEGKAKGMFDHPSRQKEEG
jgi:hypothetical protein